MFPAKIDAKKECKLTELGTKIYSDVRVTIDQYEQDILKGISEEEQLMTIRIMSEVRNNIIE